MSDGKYLSRFYGRQGTAYMSRVHLSENYKLQFFHRGDEDPDPHDHPWDFWTFPFVSYYEEWWRPSGVDGKLAPEIRKVRAFRWHFRRAEHLHRVLGTEPYFDPDKRQRIVTLMRRDTKRREWGFWPEDRRTSLGRRFVGWRRYLGLSEETPDR